MLIGPAIIAAFNLFKRPLQYERDGTKYSICGCVGDQGQGVLVGDFEQTTGIVTFLAEDLQAKDLYPPRKHDRVFFYGVSHSVDDIKIGYDGDCPVLVKLRCVG